MQSEAARRHRIAYDSRNEDIRVRCPNIAVSTIPLLPRAARRAAVRRRAGRAGARSPVPAARSRAGAGSGARSRARASAFSCARSGAKNRCSVTTRRCARNPASTMKVLTTFAALDIARARLHLAHARLCDGPDPRPGARGQPGARRRRRPVHVVRALVEFRQRPAPGGRAAHHGRRDHRQLRFSRRRATTARPSTTARTRPTTCCRTRCWSISRPSPSAPCPMRRRAACARA